MHKTPCQYYRRGFTFVELMIGIIVSSMVLCALTVFTFGVSESWTQGDVTQSTFLAGTMAVERINQTIRAAQMIDPNPTTGSLDNSTSPAACLIWADTGDGTGSTNIPDGKIQYSELALLQYNAATNSILKYTTTSAVYTATLPSKLSFLALPNLTTTTLADHIAGCQFYALNPASSNPLPSLEIVLKINSSNSSVPDQIVYTTATLRAANNKPQ